MENVTPEKQSAELSLDNSDNVVSEQLAKTSDYDRVFLIKDMSVLCNAFCELSTDGQKVAGQHLKSQLLGILRQI
jgi:uncharacterized membrane protein YjjP (DUF1212 family)